MEIFLDHVKSGLSQKPKKLSSRFFYDKKGDRIFQQIMKLEEYYLPECEMDIIHNQSNDIAKDIAKDHSNLQIIELGAGDGSKTKHLLSSFKPSFQEIAYFALDISPNILKVNNRIISEQVKEINCSSISGNYFKTYHQIRRENTGRLVLFLGGNIGNYTDENAHDFFQFLKAGLHKDDYILVAFDLAKHPRKIIRAYDDSEGITKSFNLNLLERINRELGANFDISKFDHFPFYNPVNGITSSHIISLENQEVRLSDGSTFSFEAYEAIHTEVSKKFFHADIDSLAQESQLEISKKYYDKNKGYAFVLFKNI